MSLVLALLLSAVLGLGVAVIVTFVVFVYIVARAWRDW